MPLRGVRSDPVGESNVIRQHRPRSHWRSSQHHRPVHEAEVECADQFGLSRHTTGHDRQWRSLVLCVDHEVVSGQHFDVCSTLRQTDEIHHHFAVPGPSVTGAAHQERCQNMC